MRDSKRSSGVSTGAVSVATRTNKTEAVEVDNNKRSFLKIAGIAGLGIVASQVLPKKSEAYVLGSTPTSNVVGVKDSSNTRIDPATETSLSAIKTQTNKLSFDGINNLYVQAAPNFTSQLENASSVVINPATEDTLALISTQTSKLNFDGSGNLLTSGSGGGGGGGAVQLEDAHANIINPVQDESVVLLRRMVKVMESQATVDGANRQRITLDAANVAAPVTVAQATAANLLATVSIAGAQTLATVTTVGSVTNVAAVAGQNQQMYQDVARNAYANGIRQALIFT